MIAEKVVSERVKKNGITVAELSRRTNMNPELLRRSLSGIRPLKADELVSLCQELELGISDFEVAV